MTKDCSLTRNFPLPLLNLLTHIFKYFNIPLEVEEHFETQISTVNENTLKSLKFKPLPTGHWKHEDEISVDNIKSAKPLPYLKIIPQT